MTSPRDLGPHGLPGGTHVVAELEGPHAGRGVVERMAVIGQQITHAVETADIIISVERYALVYDVPVR
jgi:GntR family transcriptional regulator